MGNSNLQPNNQKLELSLARLFRIVFDFLPKKLYKKFVFVILSFVISSLVEIKALEFISSLITSLTTSNNLLDTPTNQIDTTLGIFIVILSFALKIINFKISFSFGSQYSSELSLSNFNTLSNISYANFMKIGSGKYLSLNNDLLTGATSAVNSTLLFISNSINLLFLIAFLCVQVKFSLILVMLFPLLVIGAIIYKLLSSKVSLISSRFVASATDRFNLQSDIYSMFRYIKLYPIKDILSRSLKQREYYHNGLNAKLGFFSSIISPIFLYLFYAVLIFAFIFREQLLIRSDFLTSLIVLGVLIQRIMPMISSLNANLSTLKGRTSQLRELNQFKFLSQKYITLDSTKTSLKIRNLKNDSVISAESIIFENSQINDSSTASPLSFCIKKYATTAITGVSGSGKTSILDAIVGFRNIESGQIFYDTSLQFNNKKIVNWPYELSIGYSSQSSCLFNASFLYNITLGQNNVDCLNFSELILTISHIC